MHSCGSRPWAAPYKLSFLSILNTNSLCKYTIYVYNYMFIYRMYDVMFRTEYPFHFTVVFYFLFFLTFRFSNHLHDRFCSGASYMNMIAVSSNNVTIANP